MTHKPLWELTPDEFRRDLAQFGTIMSSIVPHVDVVGFRAPTFSLDNRTGWALQVLAESGYLYDSSIFPVRNPMYGVGNCPLWPYRPSIDDIAKEDRNGRLIEFPMSVWTLAGLRFPVCGGFYLRALPFGFIRSSLRQIQQRRPFVIYVHPWETDLSTPRLPLPPLSRFVTYHNLGSMMRRLTSLLEAFRFASMRTVLEEMGELG
jgi:polysaccharide deacetylase family protein (PEP-CTERM system associated)